MAPLLGPRQLIDLALPTGIDGSEILKFQLQDGASAAEIVARAAQVIGVVNQKLLTQYGNLLYVTEEQFAIYTQGDSTGGMTPAKTEGVQADGVRTSEIGHMFGLSDYEDALDWTKLYLRRTRSGKVDADINLIATRWESRFRRELFKRAMTNTENAIGAAGYDVPWAIGTGTNVNYIPPKYGATEFTTSHTHFVVKNDSSADYDDLLEDMVTHLRHHGYFGRLYALVAGADISRVRTDCAARFVELNPNTVTVVAGNSGAPVRIANGEFEGVPGELFGYYQSDRGLVELHYDDYIPTNYCFMTKPNGANSPMNGLAVRVEPGVGFGLTVDPQLSRSINPELERVLFNATMWVGVNDRLNGVAGYINAGAASWVNPTF